MRRIYIQTIGEICHTVDEPLPELKDLVAAAVGQPVRRISRFMQLALIGAGRCATKQSLPKETAVYLASGRGDLEITLDVMNQLFREGQSPKPLSFVNTVSNAAAFYVAKCLGLTASSSFVCSRYFAFESALQLALVDFAAGTIDAALIGSVDCAVAPLDVHRRRLGLNADAQLAEASHWVFLSCEQTATALGEIIAAASAADLDSLQQWIAMQKLPVDGTAISCGQFLASSDFESIQKQTGLRAAFDYRAGRGYYDSQSAAAVGEYLRSAKNKMRMLLHINGDSLGRYSAMLIREAG